MNPIRLFRHLSLAGASFALAFSTANALADEPVPFPPDPDVAAMTDGAKLPKLIRRVEPVTPQAGEPLKFEQRVFVAFVVDAQGKVRHASAMFGVPPAFAQAAVEAVQQWEFEPGLHFFTGSKRLVPVSTQMTVLLHFLPAAAKAAD